MLTFSPIIRAKFNDQFELNEKRCNLNNLIRCLSVIILGMTFVLSASAAMDDDSIRERLKPVGTVCITGEACAGAATEPTTAANDGPSGIYSTSCAGCHGSGVLSAPKFGDAAAWNTRLEKGEDQLIQSAITGMNAMPPRGGCASCSDEDISATVKYILENSK